MNFNFFKFTTASIEPLIKEELSVDEESDLTLPVVLNPS